MHVRVFFYLTFDLSSKYIYLFIHCIFVCACVLCVSSRIYENIFVGGIGAVSKKGYTISITFISAMTVKLC